MSMKQEVESDLSGMLQSDKSDDEQLPNKDDGEELKNSEVENESKVSEGKYYNTMRKQRTMWQMNLGKADDEGDGLSGIQSDLSVEEGTKDKHLNN